MKKILGAPFGRALCFILMCGAVLLAGCGKSGGQEDTGGGTIDPVQKTLTARLSERLDCSDYDAAIRTGDVVSRIIRSGNNGFTAMSSDGIYSEFYNVNGASYLLLPEIKCYRRIAGYSTFGNAFVKLGDKDMLFDITETDTEITEVYKPMNSNLQETYYFTFDKATGEIKRAVTKEEGAAEVVTEVDTLIWEAKEIDLPDLTGWEDVSDDAAVSDVAATKFFFYKKSITPDMIEKAGHTYEELAKLDRDEWERIAAEILESENK